MNRFVIVADDLTGANATCSMIKKTGLQTASLMVLDKQKIPKDIDVLAASTGSRAIEPEEAYDRVRQTIRTLKSKDVLVYNKRTDSTLRGNLGPEINAVLDELGDDRMAIAVPAYPDTGLFLYHDQGHIATKTLDFERTISITNSMPFLRTSVDHGTAFDIAGKNIANAISMIEAIKLAAKYAPFFTKNTSL